tara:strand:+ start:3052 stop:3165 length:114 start_codon:yes stop_codon:yes gene_type:complete
MLLYFLIFDNTKHKHRDYKDNRVKGKRAKQRSFKKYT